MMTRVFQILIVAAPVVLFAWLLMVDIAPSGEMVVKYEAGDISPYINHLLPNERVEDVAKTESGDSFARVIDEPVYFSIEFPNADFETVDVEVAFKNNKAVHALLRF